MKLDAKQLAELIQLTATARGEDTLGCNGCFELMDQLAQAELDGLEIPHALEMVQIHLEQCTCCRDEYDALLTALREVES
ncbi:MAG: hypothetical protein U0936_13245 [Planctomycetaceae bacterium]